MDQGSARAILTWHYDAPYDVYNLDAGDPEHVVQALLDPRNAYYAITCERQGLVAYCCFGPDAQVPGGDYRVDALDIGLGVRPDLTGRGQGYRYVDAALDFGNRTFPATAFRVTIAAFNQRALRVWTKAGFRSVQTFPRKGDGKAFVMLMQKP